MSQKKKSKARPAQYAQEFGEIADVLLANQSLQSRALSLIQNAPIPGKAIEETDRLHSFRSILKNLVQGELTILEAYLKTVVEIPRHTSLHSDDRRVFSKNWAERLIRVQLSRFYNQAVMEELLERKETQCYVPHTSSEEKESECTQLLAGKHHSLKKLYDRLIESYEKGNWQTAVKIPDHPYCSHVIQPPQKTARKSKKIND